MAEKSKFKWEYAGGGKLLKCPEMQGILENKASEIARRCGEGYDSDLKMMGMRVIASTYAAKNSARRDNLKNNTILKKTYEVANSD